MSSKTPRIIGWVLSVLISLFLIGASGVPKFIEWEGKAEMFDKMGVTNDLIMKIGVLEIALALLFLVPRAGFVAAILLTGYLGGAVMTHVRISDLFYFPILLGIVMWIALGLRQPGIFTLALGKQVAPRD
ncbi:MAG: DoxX family protein [Pirellulales bacterium]|nr:DoxX family protein [Pirellulales bacterium]